MIEDNYTYNSSTFRFQFNSIKKNYSFNIGIFPRGNQNKIECEDHIGVFINSLNKEELQLRLSIQFLNKKGHAILKWETDKKMLPDSDCGWKKLFSRKKMFAEAKTFLPDGTLTIRCDIVIIVADVLTSSYDYQFPMKRCQKSLSSDLDKLLNTANCSDFKIVCQGHTYNVHKTILVARSDVFAAMLSMENEETKTNQMVIEDFDKDVVQQMVKFIYTGSHNKTETVSPELLLLVDKYDLSDLVSHCKKVLADSIKLDNAVATLDVAVKTSSKHLLKLAARFVGQNLSKIRCTSEWKKIKKENPAAVVSVLKEL